VRAWAVRQPAMHLGRVLLGKRGKGLHPARSGMRGPRSIQHLSVWAAVHGPHIPLAAAERQRQQPRSAPGQHLWPPCHRIRAPRHRPAPGYGRAPGHRRGHADRASGNARGKAGHGAAGDHVWQASRAGSRGSMRWCVIDGDCGRAGVRISPWRGQVDASPACGLHMRMRAPLDPFFPAGATPCAPSAPALAQIRPARHGVPGGGAWGALHQCRQAGPEEVRCAPQPGEVRAAATPWTRSWPGGKLIRVHSRQWAWEVWHGPSSPWLLHLALACTRTVDILLPDSSFSSPCDSLQDHEPMIRTLILACSCLPPQPPNGDPSVVPQGAVRLHSLCRPQHAARARPCGSGDKGVLLCSLHGSSLLKARPWTGSLRRRAKRRPTWLRGLPSRPSSALPAPALVLACAGLRLQRLVVEGAAGQGVLSAGDATGRGAAARVLTEGPGDAGAWAGRRQSKGAQGAAPQ
jgi:hypothetical protein